MPSSNRIKSRRQHGHRRGAVLVLMALLLPIVLMLSAFAMNVANMELNRTELQVSTDAAARAGGRDMLVFQSSLKRKKCLLAIWLQTSLMQLRNNRNS